MGERGYTPRSEKWGCVSFSRRVTKRLRVRGLGESPKPGSARVVSDFAEFQR
jgi:hypothetical protein